MSASTMSTPPQPLFLGLDLSTQALKASLLDSSLSVLSELEVRFDLDLSHYGTKGGVLPPSPADLEGSVAAPVAMYVEAIDLLAQRINQAHWPVGSIAGISAAGQQHASVYFSRHAPRLLTSVSGTQPLLPQLEGAFSRPLVPNWQDSSTLSSCTAFEALYPDSAAGLARVTGSKAHTRFTGPQIHAFRLRHPQAYRDTGRISLVSSFVTTLLCAGGGQEADAIKPIDESDACGMNLWDMRPDAEAQAAKERERLEPGWNWELLRLASGELDPTPDQEAGGASELERKLGPVSRNSGSSVGRIGRWWVERCGFPPTCQILPGTGDNPATLLAFTLADREALVSLGTSDTLMVATNRYVPHAEFHAFLHPAQSKGKREYFNMLVYKSGSLAREWVRDQFCEAKWDVFNQQVERWKLDEEGETRMGFYWLRPEIIPSNAHGIHRFLSPSPSASSSSFTRVSTFPHPGQNAAAILETQFLNYRQRSEAILSTSPSASPHTPQDGAREREGVREGLKTLYAVGGASSNPVICQTLADVFDVVVAQPTEREPTEDGEKKEKTKTYNFCSVGAAYKAAWGTLRKEGEAFDVFVQRIKASSSPAAARRVRVLAKPRKERALVYNRAVEAWAELEKVAVAFKEQDADRDVQ